MAVAGPQEPDAPRAVDVEIPAIEVVIPELDIQVPGLDLQLPALDLYLPSWHMHIPQLDLQVLAHELEVPGMDIEVPELAIAVPPLTITIPDWDYDAGDWWESWEAHPQDAELDTVFDVSPRARLEVRNHAGEIIVRTWDRNAVRIEASHSSHDRVKVFQSESAVKIKSEARHGHPDIVDYKITAPKSMPLDLWGFYTDIWVDGAASGVRVETLNGAVQIRDCAGEISLRSVEGDITLQRSQGRVEVNNVENDITITDFEGELFIESIGGDIRLEGIQSRNVEAKTVDGDLFYDGAIADDGRYRLTTHDGDVVVSVPENINATVSVATFDGEFEAAFPIKLDKAEAGRRLSFVIGSGSARLELHSFDGDIQLNRR